MILSLTFVLDNVSAILSTHTFGDINGYDAETLDQLSEIKESGFVQIQSSLIVSLAKKPSSH
jgi:hypothetical protein